MKKLGMCVLLALALGLAACSDSDQTPATGGPGGTAGQSGSGGSGGAGATGGGAGAAGTGGAAGMGGTAGSGGSSGGGSLGEAGLVPNYDPYTLPVDAIHVDPTNAADSAQDGSLAHPYDSFGKLSFSDGAVVVVKRGTTIDIDVLEIKANGVTLGAYGTGDAPVIHSTAVAAGSNKYAVYTGDKHDIVVRDLEIYAPDATSLLRFQGGSNVRVVNCKLHGAYWGVRTFSIDGFKLENSEIYDILEDGVFVQGVTNIEIAHLYVHDVNQNWKPPYTSQADAGGDGVQFDSCNKWHVHHNVIDRTNSANKFCFISNNPNQDDGVFEYNVLSGPRTTGGDGGASIYLHDGNGLVIRYNLVQAPTPSPFYSHAEGLKIYGNVFTGASGSLFASGSAEVLNNLFFDQNGGVSGGAITAQNNIFSLAGGSTFDVQSLTEDHNLLTSGTPGSGSFLGDPKLVAPTQGDFHLGAGSDAIDKGADVGLSEDLDGVSLPQGGGFDIGPYEYVP